jgi:hypothetical protein
VTPVPRLTAAVLGTPDPQGPARSYQRLLGWPLRDDGPEGATLRPADGGPGLSFQLEAGHVPPEPGIQQMQLHLDVEVADLVAASAHAEAAGARFLSRCTEPHEDVRIFADPAGHPCCLFVRLGDRQPSSDPDA